MPVANFAVLGEQVQSILDEHGGPELLLTKYEEIAAYNTNNQKINRALTCEKYLK